MTDSPPIGVHVDPAMSPDRIAIVSPIDPRERLPGESYTQALHRLGRIIVLVLDAPERSP